MIIDARIKNTEEKLAALANELMDLYEYANRNTTADYSDKMVILEYFLIDFKDS